MDREVLNLGILLCLLSVALIVFILRKYSAIVNKAQSVANLTITRAQSQVDMKSVISDKCSQKLLENAEYEKKRILKQAQRRADAIIKKSKNRALEMIELAKRKKAQVIEEAEREQQALIESTQSLVAHSEARIDQLKSMDQELQARLKHSKAIIADITRKSCDHIADVIQLNSDELLLSQNYQDEIAFINRNLKLLAASAIDGVKQEGNDKGIVKLVSMSAKADLVGALLLATVEMLCCKTTAYNGSQSLEQLSECIFVTESLVKCIDSRAEINEAFRMLLIKRLEAEIHFKEAEQLAKEQDQGFREQLLEEHGSEEAI